MPASLSAIDLCRDYLNYVFNQGFNSLVGVKGSDEIHRALPSMVKYINNTQTQKDAIRKRLESEKRS